MKISKSMWEKRNKNIFWIFLYGIIILYGKCIDKLEKRTI